MSKRAWCFTCFNEEACNILEIANNAAGASSGNSDGQSAERSPREGDPLCLRQGRDVKYCVYQLEQCPDTGRRHIQGYVAFNKRVAFGVLSKRLPILDGAHWEAAKGSCVSNRDYCSKSDSGLGCPWEVGEQPTQGKRTDLDAAAEIIKASPATGVKEVADQYPGTFVKYHRGFEALASQFFDPRRVKPTVYWFHGKTGTGKSKEAKLMCIRNGWSVYYKRANNKWWGGYRQQHCVIINDLREGDWPFADLLNLFDYDPYRAEYKGGEIEVSSPVFIVTAPVTPEYMFQAKHGDDDVSQLTRRIDEVREFTGDGVPTEEELVLLNN